MPQRTRLVLLAALIGSGCSSEHVVSEFTLGQRTLRVSYEEPWAPSAFGPRTIVLYDVTDGRARRIARVSHHNDGVTPTSRDVELLDSGPAVWTLVVRGDEQDDDHWRIYMEAGSLTAERMPSSANIH